MKTKEILERLSDEYIKCERRIHQGWKEMDNVRKKDPFKFKGFKFASRLFGKYQYIYSNRKGKISLVWIMTGLKGRRVWEICCLNGDMFNNLERFGLKKDAVKRIMEYLK